MSILYFMWIFCSYKYFFEKISKSLVLACISIESIFVLWSTLKLQTTIKHFSQKYLHLLLTNYNEDKALFFFVFWTYEIIYSYVKTRSHTTATITTIVKKKLKHFLFGFAHLFTKSIKIDKINLTPVFHTNSDMVTCMINAAQVKSKICQI